MTTYPEESLPVLHFDEPQLEFNFRQITPHPKDGLFLYGPHSKAHTTREVRVGVLGTPKGIGYFREWAKRMKAQVRVPPPGKTEKKDRLHLSNFPGLEEAFGISINEADLATYPIDSKAIDQATRILNLHEAVKQVVKLYVDRVRRHRENDERAIDLWILVVPEIIFERCKPNAKRVGLAMETGEFVKRQKTRSDLPLLRDVLSSEAIFDDVPDFHRQVKAEFLAIPQHRYCARRPSPRTRSRTRPAILSEECKISRRWPGILRRDYTTRPSQGRPGSFRVCVRVSATSGSCIKTYRTTRTTMSAVQRKCF